jgi:hypothetical protein
VEAKGGIVVGRTEGEAAVDTGGVTITRAVEAGERVSCQDWIISASR